jgi:hypothetical protein
MSLKQNSFKWAMGVFAAALLVEGIVLVMASVRLAEQNRELKKSHRVLRRLNERIPFPSLENKEALNGNLDALEFRVGELAAAMARDSFPADAVGSADFSARAQDVIERFRQRAALAGVSLPKSLEVGFSKYASGGAVPDPKHVPRLSRQLYSVERVADVLVRGGVDSIDGLTRTIFETQAKAEPQNERRRARRQPSGARPAASAAVNEHAMYRIERVGVSFMAENDVVMRVLNLFAAMPHCMAVAEFSHESQTGILSYNPEAVKRGEASDDATSRYLAGGILTGENALSRPERLIAGNELIHVTLSVDVYNFDAEGRSRNENAR